MLRAAVIDNGCLGTERSFADSDSVHYRIERIGEDWNPDFSSDDLLVVPNGADHVAMDRVRGQVARVLGRGGAVFCFCGFFTPWLPGNRWVHDNTRPNREVRYRAGADRLGLLDGVELARLNWDRHGISGWWACGAIETADPASVVIEDQWGRVLMVADTSSTPGLIIATASGPLADPAPGKPSVGVARLYRNCLAAAAAHRRDTDG